MMLLLCPCRKIFTPKKIRSRTSDPVGLIWWTVLQFVSCGQKKVWHFFASWSFATLLVCFKMRKNKSWNPPQTIRSIKKMHISRIDAKSRISAYADQSLALAYIALHLSICGVYLYGSCSSWQHSPNKYSNTFRHQIPIRVDVNLTSLGDHLQVERDSLCCFLHLFTCTHLYVGLLCHCLVAES